MHAVFHRVVIKFACDPPMLQEHRNGFYHIESKITGSRFQVALRQTKESTNELMSCVTGHTEVKTIVKDGYELFHVFVFIAFF